MAVTTTYLRIHGEVAARRLKAHELLQTINRNLAAMTESGLVAENQEEYDNNLGLRESLLDEFGAGFGSHYGWAADVTKKRRPTFENVENAAGMASWRRAYKSVTTHVHSTSRPLHDELFVRHGRDPAAPTGNGFAAPAIMTIRSLLQATSALLGLYATWEDLWAAELRTAAILDAVAREAMDEFASHEWVPWGLPHKAG